MKKTVSILVLLFLFSIKIFSQAITMTTSHALGSTITFYLAASSSTTVQVDFGDGNLVNKTVATTERSISGTLIGTHTIKIYGSGITSLDCTSNQLTILDVSKNTTLTTLTCYSNELTSLDVSKNTALTYLNCYSNPLTTNLDVSKNTALTYLNCQFNGLTNLDVSKNTALKVLRCLYNPLTSLDISNNTALTSLHCSMNGLTSLNVDKNTALTDLNCNSNKLTSLDVSNNTALTNLECFQNKLTSLDVSKNTALTKLRCFSNPLTSLDVSKNSALTYLECYLNKLTSLDVSTNTALTDLYCRSNQLTSLDVSKNTVLTYLECNSNQLTSLDVSKNTALKKLKCYSNQLKFSTLPSIIPAYTTYTYQPQTNLQIPKNTKTELDLSSEYTINGTTTVYTIKTKGGITLSEGTDYTNNAGIITFLNPPTDSVYCTMTNTQFPALTLQTTNTQAIEKITMTTKNAVGSTINLSLEASTPTSVKVDYGDGNLVSKTINTVTTDISGTLVRTQTIKIYSLGVTYLDCYENQLTSLDVSHNEDLEHLYCDSNQLTSLDVSTNTALTKLNCSSNQLKFSTLPKILPSYTLYKYYPQNKVQIPKNTKTELDLSSEYTINSTTTVYAIKTKGGNTLNEGTDYTNNAGIITFLKSQSDSVYCSMTNTEFPALTLQTTNIFVGETSGINDVKSQDFKWTLSGKKLEINSLQNCELMLVDIQGRVINSTKLITGTNTISLKNTGIYLLKISGNNTNFTKKIFVK